MSGLLNRACLACVAADDFVRRPNLSSARVRSCMCVSDRRSFNVSDVANDNARRVWNRSRGRETIEVTLIRAFAGHRQGSCLPQPGVGGSGRRVTENRTLIVCGLGVVVCYLWVLVAASSNLSFIFQSCKMMQKVL